MRNENRAFSHFVVMPSNKKKTFIRFHEIVSVEFFILVKLLNVIAAC